MFEKPWYLKPNCSLASQLIEEMSLKMKGKLVLFFLTFLTAIIMLSCNSNEEFDSANWKNKAVDWQMTDFREKMVDDLLKSDTLIGMDKNQVIELLGKPESVSKGEIKYLLREKYGLDIDPEYISYLKIEFNEMGQVSNCNIKK